MEGEFKLGLLNTAAVKRHALKVSREARGGKFTRVSSEFVTNMEAELSAKLRSLVVPCIGRTGVQVAILEGDALLSATAKKKVVEAVNIWMAEEIHRKINQNSLGKTI